MSENETAGVPTPPKPYKVSPTKLKPTKGRLKVADLRTNLSVAEAHLAVLFSTVDRLREELAQIRIKLG